MFTYNTPFYKGVSINKLTVSLFGGNVSWKTGRDLYINFLVSYLEWLLIKETGQNYLEKIVKSKIVNLLEGKSHKTFDYY